MTKCIPALMLAMLAAGASCSRGNNRAADTTLNSDLSLAAQQQHYQPMDTVSAAERADSAANRNGLVSAPVARRTASSTGTTRHYAARTRSGSGSRSGGYSGGAGTYSSGGTTTTASSPTVVKHTRRDAAIGAAAGAVLGATTSRNKVKGGLIGAAIGGILGGVIGNNVDKTKKP